MARPLRIGNRVTGSSMISLGVKDVFATEGAVAERYLDIILLNGIYCHNDMDGFRKKGCREASPVYAEESQRESLFFDAGNSGSRAGSGELAKLFQAGFEPPSLPPQERQANLRGCVGRKRREHQHCRGDLCRYARKSTILTSLTSASPDLDHTWNR